MQIAATTLIDVFSAPKRALDRANADDEKQRQTRNLGKQVAVRTHGAAAAQTRVALTPNWTTSTSINFLDTFSIDEGITHLN